MNHKFNFILAAFLLTGMLCLSCKTKKEIVYTTPIEEVREETLDTLVVSDVAGVTDSISKEYKPSATLEYDILHTKLELRFDWGKQYVIGKAFLKITPYFKPVSKVSLDAEGFDIHSVKLTTKNKDLKYEYDGTKLVVFLDTTYRRTEIFELLIDYTAKPNENEEEGSDAISSDKGLFFINPTGLEGDVPTQIWTQGETENNSRWFPTFDKPNERFTQEIYLTVEDKYLTLSNGVKVSSVKNNDGSRTDFWKQDKPHAPYLTMIAVGEYHEESDLWKGIPVQYFVEKKFSKHAKKIFEHTPEMLTFFSDKLKYPYPWEKYAQIVVHDFVSGAMENTSAVVFGDFVQKTSRELIDNDNDYIIAHEMMHHWFGDLVTCEDWSNLTLNEGFANYAEYLWFEYKYGKDRAEYHRMNEMNGYFSQVFGGGAHPLIDYYYEGKEQMFDAHSYNKGGLVLHMLRSYLGNDAFYAGLNKYLTQNAYTSVEVDELRMAFEDICGEDLHWFFDQWFHGTGHPHLDVKYTYNDLNKVLLIEVDQSNNPKGFNKTFILPVDIALYFEDGSVEYHSVTINEQKQRILIEDIKERPATYVFDGKNILLGLINENKTSEQYKAQFKLSSNFMDKMIAFTSTNDGNADLISLAIKDKFYIFRSMAINAISDSLAANFVNQLQDIALTDPHSEVRRDALLKLVDIENYDPTQICRRILDGEQAYPVIQVAMEIFGQLDPERSRPFIDKIKSDDSDYLASTLAGIMTGSDPKDLEYLENKAKNIGLYHMFEFYGKYSELLKGKEMGIIHRTALVLEVIASNKQGNMFRKYLATVTLVKLHEEILTRPQSDEITVESNLLKQMIANIVSGETNPTLKEKYQGLK